MKRLIFISAAIAGLSFLLGATFTPNPEPVKEEVNWVSMEEAATLAAQDGKKIMVDLYTGWCGWCKRMDATTYGNKEVAAYINEHYHAVKFDAEQKGDITIGGITYKYLPDAGRRGVHELAAKMVNGKLSYPTTVFFESDLQLLYRLPGYQNAKDMHQVLGYLAKDAYKDTPWDQFVKEFDAQGK